MSRPQSLGCAPNNSSKPTPLRGASGVRAHVMLVLNADDFYHDGRGPKLLKVHLANGSAHLLAIDFRSPGSDETKHLKFTGAQAFMFTPDEVVSYPTPVDWGATERGALVSLGRSDWLESFSPIHLTDCAHILLAWEGSRVGPNNSFKPNLSACAAKSA